MPGARLRLKAILRPSGLSRRVCSLETEACVCPSVPSSRPQTFSVTVIVTLRAEFEFEK